MGLYPGGLKNGINFALEPEWAYIRVGLYSEFYGINIINITIFFYNLSAKHTYECY